MGEKKVPAAGTVSVLTTFFFLLVIAAATASGDGVKMQTLNVVTLADTQQPLQQKQRSTEAESDDPYTAAAAARNRGGLKLDLLNHLDLLSPDELKDIDHNQVFMNRMTRDMKRVSALQAAAAATGGRTARVVSGLPFGSGEYFTRLGVGTPAENMYLVLDTGSDLSWIQCTPCKSCYKQTDPIFDSRNSGTFTPVYCGQPWCNNINEFALGCPRKKKIEKCLYGIGYGDGSYTVGDLATDTLTVMSSGDVKNFAFGCSRNSKGSFAGAAGLLGLGRGKSSLPSQLAAAGITSSTFSYCLSGSAEASSSSIDFGDYASSVKTSLTSLLPGSTPRTKNFYFIQLVGISVGGEMVDGIEPSMFQPTKKGGLIIDSGTRVTRLYRPAYEAMRTAFQGKMTTLKRAPSPYSLFDTCYEMPKTDVKVPTVELHFSGKTTVSLPASNYMIPVTEDTICLAFAATNDTLSILGSIQQQGFRVTYNAAKSQLGFTSEAC